MILHISHQTKYIYSEPVFLNPHHLYFHPANRAYFNIHQDELAITPRPDGLSQRLDAENNVYSQCWWSEMTSDLVIKAQVRVESQAFNPYHFFIESSGQVPSLELYKKAVFSPTEDVNKWISDLGLRTSDPMAFITEMCSNIHQDWGYHERHDTSILTPQQCFDEKKGSCRDLAWMMVNLLRIQGFPARFVSGYSHNPEIHQEHELHAWVEVWLPGAGWIGVDPTLGLLADYQYIPVACSHSPTNTLPVHGSFAGSARSTMSYQVSIDQLD